MEKEIVVPKEFAKYLKIEKKVVMKYDKDVINLLREEGKPFRVVEFIHYNEENEFNQ